MMSHEISPPLTKRAIRHNKALKQALKSVHGLGLARWLRVVESDESRDREDIKEDKRVRIALPDEMESSCSYSSATAHGSADSSKKTTGQRKRRCASMAAETDTLSEYELERFKRVKANQEVLMSLGIEHPLPKTRPRSRKKPQNILLRVREEDNVQPGRGNMSIPLAASEAEGMTSTGANQRHNGMEVQVHLRYQKRGTPQGVQLAGEW